MNGNEKAGKNWSSIQSDPSKFTPMIRQYLSIKEQNRDVILMFRLGDFYELFFEDALLCAQELQLFLTRKGAGNNVKIPMCGFPHHAYLNYAQKLLDNGHKVAIVEQLEDASKTKRLVRRGVIQVVTPGANLDLKNSDNNFLVTLEKSNGVCSLVYADLSTGEVFATNLIADDREIISKLLSLEAKELVVSSTVEASFVQLLKENTAICLSYENNCEANLDMEPLFARLADSRQITAVARLMNYLTRTQKRELSYFKPAVNLLAGKTLKLDYSTLVNLELLKSLDGKHIFGTLYWLLNHCSTPMGSRFLKTAIAEPLSDLVAIKEREKAVAWLVENYLSRQELAEKLRGVYDLDRLVARISYGSSNAHDMLQLQKSLQAIPGIRETLATADSELLTAVQQKMLTFAPLLDLLDRAVREDAPLTITEGGIFKKGYDESLDNLIETAVDSKEWIKRLESRERDRTGIRTLKVGYTKAFGYYIEVSKGTVGELKPEYGYVRKQTLTTGERYTTNELQERESAILYGDRLRMEKEYQLFQDLRRKVDVYTRQIQDLSGALALLDFAVSLAVISASNNYICPEFSDDRQIEVIQARHPVIEKAQPEKEFVANDYRMDRQTDILIVTGPNMGGKSTYMREFALIVIMAQLGMYVPAARCHLPLFDAIYTRIGASDDLIKGQSTFMVEMDETNKALRQASASSLILFDEIGRGTATYDGMALAQAILEYDATKIRAKTFFSTHYHELTALTKHYPGMHNVHVSVAEENGQLTFLYKVKEGPMDKSYGINVAQLAGLPTEVIQRAFTVLKTLENEDIALDKLPALPRVETRSDEDSLLKELREIDPVNLAPLEALRLIFAWHDRAKRR